MNKIQNFLKKKRTTIKIYISENHFLLLLLEKNFDQNKAGKEMFDIGEQLF